MKNTHDFRFWLLALCSFGFAACASQPPRQFTHFPAATELQTPEHRQSHYQQARIDFERAAAGQRPQFAQWRDAIRDGGTTFYRGVGYDLTVWHRYSSPDGVSTYIYAGPEINFDRTLSPRGASFYSAATTRKHQ